MVLVGHWWSLMLLLVACRWLLWGRLFFVIVVVIRCSLLSSGAGHSSLVDGWCCWPWLLGPLYIWWFLVCLLRLLPLLFLLLLVSVSSPWLSLRRCWFIVPPTCCCDETCWRKYFRQKPGKENTFERHFATMTDNNIFAIDRPTLCPQGSRRG